MEFLVIRYEPPETAALRRNAQDLIQALRVHIQNLPDDETRSLATALLDLAVSAANCLARSDPGTLDLTAPWDHMPPPGPLHVQAAVMRLALAHPAGHGGALECIQDVNTVIRDLTKIG